MRYPTRALAELSASASPATGTLLLAPTCLRRSTDQRPQLQSFPPSRIFVNIRFLFLEYARALCRASLAEVGALEERGQWMRKGTIVDAMIIIAPPATKTKQKSRDPEMHQTNNGSQWNFGIKAHFGVDVASGIVLEALRSRAQRYCPTVRRCVATGAEGGPGTRLFAAR